MANKRTWTIVSLLSLSLLSGVVGAQQGAGESTQPATSEAPSNILEEVVVSGARKREENVQNTPITETALDATVLERANVTDLTNISALAPNLQISRTLASADALNIYLRGFGAQTNDPSNDPHVAVFVDGIYQPTISGTLIDMFDVQQVEVLGGPQGTLLGKNALIGAISVTTAKPTGKLDGVIEADYGSYDHTGVRAKFDFPLLTSSSGDSILAGKISYVGKQGGDYVKDYTSGQHDYGGEDIKAGRLALLFTPGGGFEWNLITYFQQLNNPQQGGRNVSYSGGIPGTHSSVTQPAPLDCLIYYSGNCPRYPYGTTNPGYTERPDAQTFDVTSNMSYRLPAVTFSVVAGYIDYDLHERSSVAGLPFAVIDGHDDITRSEQKSAEFRASSNKGGGADMDGKLDWLVGGFFSDLDFSFTNNLFILVPVVGNVYQAEAGKNKTEAAFMHAIYHLTDEWSGSFGARYSDDTKEHSYQIGRGTPFYSDNPLTNISTTVEAGVQYQFQSNKMTYFRFAQGYQAGGFLGFPGTPGGGSSYLPSKNNEYEIGLKSDWFDQRLRFNIDYFLNKLTDLQIQGVAPTPNPPGFLQTTTNAGAATVQGVEMQLIAVPVDALTLRLTAGYLHPKYTKYQSTVCTNVAGVLGDCSGIPFAYAPKLTLDPGADYRMSLPNGWGTATISADADYKSELYASDPPFPSSRQGGYALVNATISFKDRSEKYSLDFYGTNLTNKEYITEFSDSGGLTISQVDGRPREWGIRVKAKLGN